MWCARRAMPRRWVCCWKAFRNCSTASFRARAARYEPSWGACGSGFNATFRSQKNWQGDNNMFEIVDSQVTGPVIKVIGVGGAGGNAVNHMIEQTVQGVEFIAVNTDAQVLSRNKAANQIQLGTSGLGAGAKPEEARAVAIADRDRIEETVAGAHMVFITAGMGGGTGTGAAPVIAEVARSLGILTVAVVTKPFTFEGSKRMKTAEQGLEELAPHVDSLIVILNDKLEEVQVPPEIGRAHV